MKSDARRTAGAARLSGRDAAASLRPAWLGAAILLLATTATAAADSMYKYRGDDGEWIYSDRPPDDGSRVEIRALPAGQPGGGIKVDYRFVGRTVVLTAHNGFYAPVELALDIDTIRGMEYPPPDRERRWVLQPRSDTDLLRLGLLEDGSAPFLEYRFRYLAGDPAARHQPEMAYRAPFAIASDYPVTQAYPEVATHTTPDSYYAVDIAMPIGTDVFAARDGIVFDVASNNFSGGLDPARDGPNANVVRILHDDGTYAIYAHLNTNTIRVKPGDRVQRGQYIADSGNTGFSSGPHLHFAVVRNAGMRIESVPVTFMGRNAESIVPAAGMALTAY
jgi:murein DD-endopeptidase MepM/ murein hydrolase activator NlpD